MAFIWAICLIGIGGGLLIKGADWCTDGIRDLARHIGVSILLISILLAGAEPEEMLTAAIASGRGAGGLAIGDIIGTNITICTLAVGLSALLFPISLPKHLRSHAIIATVASIIPLFMLFGGVISRLMGILLLFVFAIYIAVLIRFDRSSFVSSQKENDEDEPSHFWQTVAMAIGGLVAMTVGGPLLVEGALQLTTAIGLQQSIIGLTVVALGTGSEMIALAIIAARKHTADVLIGGIIGSFVYNLLVTLGLAAIIHQLSLDSSPLQIALPIMVLAYLVLMIFVFFRHIPRWAGATLIIGYLIYIIEVVWRTI
jgi:cation:H+ antiporter